MKDSNLIEIYDAYREDIESQLYILKKKGYSEESSLKIINNTNEYIKAEMLFFINGNIVDIKNAIENNGNSTETEHIAESLENLSTKIGGISDALEIIINEGE